MSSNLSLVTVLFIMCYFIKRGGNYAVTKLTRAHSDYFTDVCQNCYKYGAEPEQGICKCEPKSSKEDSGSLFLRNQRHCFDGDAIATEEACDRWKQSYVEVINTEETNSHIFPTRAMYSYQLEPLISYRNSTTGEWHFFNLSGNVLVLQNSPYPRSSQIKVTRVSSNLTKFKGYVMKLGLKLIRLDGRETKKSCLLFKAKGVMHVALNCSVPTATPVSTTTTTTATASTITVTTDCTNTTCSRKIDSQLDTLSIVAIATGGSVLVLSLICAVVVVYRYRYKFICGSRGHQSRSPEIDFDVISNPGPQTYRMQEEPVHEPVYDEVPDIYPLDKGSAGSSTNEPTVLLNPNVYEARFSVHRPTTDPLPTRPELTTNTNTQTDTGPVFQNDESKAIGQAAEDSIVFENPKVEEASSSSRECTKLSGAHEPEGQSIGDHHLHVVDDIDNRTVHPESEGTGEDLNYQVLEQDKRARSVFICPSCNENPVYQRLSMPHYCPHGATDKPKENRVSCYESLSGLGVGPRESVYARPSRSTEEESSAEDKGNRNNEEGEGLPEYHTLEQEETAVSNEDLREPANHDYKVLEGPEETGDEVDERARDSISRDPDRTSVDSDLSLEASKILNMEDNPAYAKPWKAKEDPELPLEASDFLNIENNPAYSKPWKAQENPEIPHEPLDFHNIENNPASSTPWRAKTAEPCLRRRANSL